jgi:hypothetical protein
LKITGPRWSVFVGDGTPDGGPMLRVDTAGSDRRDIAIVPTLTDAERLALTEALCPEGFAVVERGRLERVLAAAVEMKRSAEWYGFIRTQVSALQPGDLDPLPEPAAGAHDGRK